MKIKNFVFKASALLCSFAFFVAINSLEQMCVGSFYQPKVPKSLEQHRNNR